MQRCRISPQNACRPLRSLYATGTQAHTKISSFQSTQDRFHAEPSEKESRVVQNIPNMNLLALALYCYILKAGWQVIPLWKEILLIVWTTSPHLIIHSDLHLARHRCPAICLYLYNNVSLLEWYLHVPILLYGFNYRCGAGNTSWWQTQQYLHQVLPL